MCTITTITYSLLGAMKRMRNMIQSNKLFYVFHFQLTHFVMLKELKHCRSVEELVVTDSVRSKAKTFVKKYMAKFGPVYKRPPEEAD